MKVEQRPRTGIDSSEQNRAFAAGLALSAVATILMLQAMRVFISYLVFVVDQSNRATLAVVSLGVFLAVGLGGGLCRWLGVPQTAGLAAVGLAATRLGLQFWQQPEARVVLGATAVVCWGWLFLALLSVDRAAAGSGLVLGLGLDLAVRIAFRTVDLQWMPGAAAHAVTLLLAAAGGLAAWGLRAVATKAEPIPRSAVSLLALGPGLVLYHLLTGNLGLAQVKLDLDFPQAAAVLALGTALGLAAGTSVVSSGGGRRPLVGGPLLPGALVAVAALGLWEFWRERWLGPVGLVVGTAGATILLTRALVGGAPVRRPRAGSPTLWLTAGLVLQVGLLFTYYTFTGLPQVLVVASGLLLFGAAFAGLPAASSGQPRLWGSLVPTAVLAGLLIAVCGWHWLRWSEPEAGPPLARELTAMSYNIQTGFARDNYWSLEATARTIEAARPDIVVLQEVSRGWLVTTGVDEVLWLSHRLGMPAVFGASSDDGLWGNAVLTRAPIDAVTIRRYRTTENLDRGVTEVRLATEAGDLWVFSTHLDNPSGAGAVRLEQVDQLLDAWASRTPALLMGDLNATPDSDVLAALRDAGFTDLGAALGPTETTSEDGRRIDYILATDQIAARSVRIPSTWTSDHRPVVADLTLEP